MPLPVTEVERELTHTRRVRYEGYKRRDGLWDIEAHLTDVKNHDFMLKTGIIKQGVTKELVTNELIDDVNRFDAEKVAAEARAYRTGG